MKYLFLLLFLLGACKKEEASCETCLPQTNLLEAQIIDAGILAADGCGWLIRAGANDLHPKNLPDSFRVNQLPVFVSFSVEREKFKCGNSIGDGLPVVTILEIRRR